MSTSRGVGAALFLLVVAADSSAAQELAVKLRGSSIFPDTTAGGEAERLLEAYLRRRFEALGVRVTESDSVDAFEVNFSVMKLRGGAYDVAIVVTVCSCSPAQRRRGGGRGVPVDWLQYHEHDDLEAVARDAAESLYGELKVVERWRARPPR